MNCHLCEAEAVTRCHGCGALVCAEHGKHDACPNCNGGFRAGDPRHDRISATPITPRQQHGWWRPQQAEEFKPPACYQCKGLARAVCRNCQSNYCHEHAGSNGLCKDCRRTANLGVYVFAGVAGLLTLFYLGHWLFGLFM